VNGDEEYYSKKCEERDGMQVHPILRSTVKNFKMFEGTWVKLEIFSLYRYAIVGAIQYIVRSFPGGYDLLNIQFS